MSDAARAKAKEYWSRAWKKGKPTIEYLLDTYAAEQTAALRQQVDELRLQLQTAQQDAKAARTTAGAERTRYVLADAGWKEMNRQNETLRAEVDAVRKNRGDKIQTVQNRAEKAEAEVERLRAVLVEIRENTGGVGPWKTWGQKVDALLAAPEGPPMIAECLDQLRADLKGG